MLPVLRAWPVPLIFAGVRLIAHLKEPSKVSAEGPQGLGVSAP